MHDVRYLCKKVIKAKKQGQDLEPSKIEGTIMGIPKSVYDIALTYPRCLKFSSFVRYMLSPTFCYQMEYPTETGYDWYGLFKYFCHMLICLVLEFYLIF